MKISGNLKDYVSVYDNFIDKDLLDETVKNLDKAEWHLHTYVDPVNNTEKSNPYDLSVSHSNVFGKKEIQDSFWNVINRYVREDHKELADWYNNWAGYTELRFNKYDVGTSMDIHCDHITTMFDGNRKGIPTLSILGLLNDQFEGGEFVMWGDEVIDLKAGSVIVFPSNFLYPHHVMPIKSGIRYSCVSWVW
jgi:hypothetical protein